MTDERVESLALHHATARLNVAVADANVNSIGITQSDKVNAAFD